MNNAGVVLETHKAGRIHETDEDLWDTTMRVNAKSVFLGCKYATAQMLTQEPHESGDRGWIINMASICGLIGTLKTRVFTRSPVCLNSIYDDG